MSENSRIRTKAEDALTPLFEAALPDLAGSSETRRAAMTVLEEKGLPTRRVENFKYTDLRSLLRQLAPLASGKSVAAAVPAGFIEPLAARLVLVDGTYRADLSSLHDAIGVESYKVALEAGHAQVPETGEDSDVIQLLNAAFAGDGVTLSVAPGVVIENPVEIVHLSSEPAGSFTRVEVALGNKASLTLVERFEGADSVQRHAVSHYLVADEARLEVLRVQDEAENAVHLGAVEADLGAGANLTLTHLAYGAGLARTETRLAFHGQGATATINGATHARASQHVDHMLIVDHLVPECESRELFKSAVDDRAKVIFQGRINVALDAQKTDGRMGAHAVLLSEDAEAVAKPELEIFADDVACAHGATVGQLDDDLLFYLLARGIPRKEAEALLLQAFLGEAIEGIVHEGLREAALEQLVARLEAR